MMKRLTTSQIEDAVGMGFMILIVLAGLIYGILSGEVKIK